MINKFSIFINSLVNISISLVLYGLMIDLYFKDEQMLCFFLRFLILILNIIYSLILIPISNCECRCCGRIFQKIKRFIKNSLCHIMNPLSYFLTISLFIESCMFIYPYFYYGRRIFQLIKWKQPNDCIMSLLSSVTLTIEILSNARKKHKFSSNELSFISLFIIICELIYGIAHYKFLYNIPPFIFLDKISLSSYIEYCGISLIICIACYLFSLFMIKYKYRCFPPNDEYDEIENDFELDDHLDDI